ncbi:hypothetical protein [Aquimarina sp. MMG016]|uniref:hypothetical protein n=1 Tax=Aquimarina sp. MMG016 TaxID=2822690 RepID=UPI001B3A56BD|nr:hypothetical protein [Aquimarina sp. MMG016]MBQ4818898.1 hypothetical protein [Aquimarina sp. MMG016]
MHLFIVGQDTLPIHLRYSFVGVHKPNDCSWDNVTINPSSENSQASMYADICRVHTGDEILLYLERTTNDNLREGGRFLGIFEVVSDRLFYEPDGAYIPNTIDRNLIYRLQIRPKIIYPNGVTEWQAMDEMTDFDSVHDIPWSIIYRKMTGSRGCTPLLPHESDIIKKMLDLRNHGQILHEYPIYYDFNSQMLAHSNDYTEEYLESTTNFQDIRPRLLHLINHSTRKWESHLQAYLMQEIKRNIELTNNLFPQTQVTWLGNEIYAGAGMQRIDILVYSENTLNKFIHLIELKSVEANEDTAGQVNRYIKWLKAHIPGISVHQIIPTIIAPAINDTYNNSIRTFLKGHGINQYRNVIVDNNLNFEQTIHLV